jgi:hypothetical protein
MENNTERTHHSTSRNNPLRNSHRLFPLLIFTASIHIDNKIAIQLAPIQPNKTRANITARFIQA